MIWVIFVFWPENAAVSFLVAACSINSRFMLAFISRVQLSDQQVKSYHTKGILRSFIHFTKEHFDNRNKTCLMSTFPYFNYHESWTAVVTCVIAFSLTLCWRLQCTSRESVGCCHHHYHHHPHSNPLERESIEWEKEVEGKKASPYCS